MPRHQKKPIKKQQTPGKTSSKESSIRIIAGQWRGRKLKVLCEEGLRPTGDRQRETLFNWLMNDINGARVLDLYAGSGALGFEALSRGAQLATFIDSNHSTTHQLKNNIRTLCSSRQPSASCHQADALQWISRQSHASQYYDVIFIDPPFSQNLWLSTLKVLEQSGFLQAGTLIYIEHPASHFIALPERLSLRKTKRTGAVCMNLLEAIEDSEVNSR